MHDYADRTAMMGLFLRLLLFVIAPMTALFAARESLNVQIAQTLVATLAFLAIGVILIIWASRENI